MPIQKSKHDSDVDKRIKELTARIETFLEKTRQIEIELSRKKGKRSG